jgi:hypothetical protein
MDERDLTFKKTREMERGLYGIGEEKELDY